MKNILFFLLFFLSTNCFSQTIQDSVIIHFPNHIDCDSVDYFRNGILQGSQALVPKVTALDFSKFTRIPNQVSDAYSDYTKFAGIPNQVSDAYSDYTMIVRDYFRLKVPDETLYIVPYGCHASVQIYTKVFKLVYNE